MFRSSAGRTRAASNNPRRLVQQDCNGVNTAENGALTVDIPKLEDLEAEGDPFGPVTAGSPTFTRGVTDRSYISRMSKNKLKEVPMSDSRLSMSSHDHVSIHLSLFGIQHNVLLY